MAGRIRAGSFGAVDEALPNLIDVRNHADRLWDGSTAGRVALDELARRPDGLRQIGSGGSAVQPQLGEGGPEAPFTTGEVAMHPAQVAASAACVKP
jgi:hypothetical protein